MQQAVKESALEAALPALQNREPLDLEAAYKVRDASMLCSLYMHSSLAQRSSVLITAKASSCARNPCSDPDCPMMAVMRSQASTSRGPSRVCYGNRFERNTPGSRAAAAGDEGGDGLLGGADTWQLVIHHHKGSSRGAAGQVLQLTDLGERLLLSAWEDWGRPVVLLYGGEEDCEAMYLDDSGQPFTDPTLRRWWQHLERRLCPGLSLPALHKLRHVFVTDRQADPTGTPGPEMGAAARGMLHSPAQWTSGPYDLGRERRQMQQYAADMAEYRAHKMQRLAPPPPSAQEQQQQYAAGAGAMGTTTPFPAMHQQLGGAEEEEEGGGEEQQQWWAAEGLDGADEREEGFTGAGAEQGEQAEQEGEGWGGEGGFDDGCY